MLRKNGGVTFSYTERLNWLRSAVLGANDGIVSIAGLVVGVAGATDARANIAMAGLAGVIAGALSMAAGEYISVSSQRDAEKALLAQESDSLRDNPEAELHELTLIYVAKGLKHRTALRVAKELTDHDAFRAHAEAEHGITPNDLVNPWHAAIASATAFVAGSVIPMTFILLPSTSARVPVTFVGVIAALAVTGAVSAYVGNAKKRRAVLRVVLGGALAMIVTYSVGELFDISGI